MAGAREKISTRTPLRRVGQLVALAALVGAVMLCVGAGSASATWAGKNGAILFADGGEAGPGSGLWSIQANGGRLRQLTSNPTDSEVQASRDRRWIVFARTVEAGGESSAHHIFIARADGSAVTEVTTGPVFDRSPSFSRSGDRILFSRFVRASGEKAQDVEHIFSVKRNGTGLRQLTSGPVSDRNPVISPNGRVVAFDRAGVRPGQGARHVYTMRPDGSRVVDATPQAIPWCSQPDFSPSGDRIVFVRGYPGSADADLFTMRPNGKGLSRLTGRARHPVGKLSNPAYSPNGKFVVAQRTPEQRSPSMLEVIRIRDRARISRLGEEPRSPSMEDPAWLVR